MFLLDHATYCPPAATRTTLEELVSSWERLTHLSEFRVSNRTLLLWEWLLLLPLLLFHTSKEDTSEDENCALQR
jgi:hypothetical protein